MTIAVDLGRKATKQTNKQTNKQIILLHIRMCSEIWQRQKAVTQCLYNLCFISKSTGMVVMLRWWSSCYFPGLFSKVFFRGGPFFLVNEWIQIPLKSGHHWPASKTPFKWCFTGVPMMAQHWMLGIFQGIRTSISKKPYIFVAFHGGGGGGGGGPDPLPPLDRHMFF